MLSSTDRPVREHSGARSPPADRGAGQQADGRRACGGSPCGRRGRPVGRCRSRSSWRCRCSTPTRCPAWRASPVRRARRRRPRRLGDRDGRPPRPPRRRRTTRWRRRPARPGAWRRPVAGGSAGRLGGGAGPASRRRRRPVTARPALLLARSARRVGPRPAAGAQEAGRPAPLVGGGSFLTAPLIETGELQRHAAAGRAALLRRQARAGPAAAGRRRAARRLRRQVLRRRDGSARDRDAAARGRRADPSTRTSPATGAHQDFGTARIEFVSPPALSRSAACDEVGDLPRPGHLVRHVFVATTKTDPVRRSSSPSSSTSRWRASRSRRRSPSRPRRHRHRPRPIRGPTTTTAGRRSWRSSGWAWSGWRWGLVGGARRARRALSGRCARRCFGRRRCRAAAPSP